MRLNITQRKCDCECRVSALRHDNRRTNHANRTPLYRLLLVPDSAARLKRLGARHPRPGRCSFCSYMPSQPARSMLGTLDDDAGLRIPVEISSRNPSQCWPMGVQPFTPLVCLRAVRQHSRVASNSFERLPRTHIRHLAPRLSFMHMLTTHIVRALQGWQTRCQRRRRASPRALVVVSEGGVRIDSPPRQRCSRRGRLCCGS